MQIMHHLADRDESHRIEPLFAFIARFWSDLERIA